MGHNEEVLARIKNAISIVKEGHPYTVGSLWMVIDENKFLNISAYSKYNDLKNVRKPGAMKEVDELKFMFYEMVHISSELANFIVDKQLKFNLNFNYGMGAIGICSEINGVIKWALAES